MGGRLQCEKVECVILVNFLCCLDNWSNLMWQTNQSAPGPPSRSVKTILRPENLKIIWKSFSCNSSSQNQQCLSADAQTFPSLFVSSASSDGCRPIAFFQTTPNLKSKLLLYFRYTLSFSFILGVDYPISPTNLPDTQKSSTIHENDIDTSPKFGSLRSHQSWPQILCKPIKNLPVNRVPN